jgi:hypothetical protein
VNLRKDHYRILHRTLSTVLLYRFGVLHVRMARLTRWIRVRAEGAPCFGRFETLGRLSACATPLLRIPRVSEIALSVKISAHVRLKSHNSCRWISWHEQR